MNKELLPHQQRVIEEANELEIKVEALCKFIDSEVFLKIDEEERKRLSTQLGHMSMYLKVLKERIDNF